MSRMTCFFLVLISGCTYQHRGHPAKNSVELQLFSPHAKEVLFHSSENNFAPQPAHKQSYDYWIIHVQYREQFSYFFTVDGTMAIPDCDCREQDNFGSFNCIYPSHL